MSIITDMGFKKPENSDTFAGYVVNECANIDLLEDELGSLATDIAAKADAASVAAKLDKSPEVTVLASAAALTLAADSVIKTAPLAHNAAVTLGSVGGTGQHSIIWYITMPEVKYAPTWDSRIKWLNNAPPSFALGSCFEVSLTTYDGGESWLGAVLAYA